MTESKQELIEYGDYQTPVSFTLNSCKYLKEVLQIEPEYIFEPTFGLGSFLKSSLSIFKKIKKVYGVEINKAYYDYTSEMLTTMDSEVEVVLHNDNIFTFDFGLIKDEIPKTSELLILGNPPWVTNSELSSIGSENLPLKDNFKALKGLDAITGKGNFDIAEYIILQLLSEFKNNNCYIAMLCKTIVARNIVRDLDKYDFHLSDIKLLTFNAADVFNVNCEAGLLLMKLGKEEDNKKICDVYNFSEPTKKIRSFGWVNDNFISDLENYNHEISIDGRCPLVWRQGLKHDCSKVMELSLKDDNGMYLNGYKDNITLEDKYIYPLLKSSDLKKHIINTTRKNVIVTQKKVREETDSIEVNSPLLWNYLNDNASYLDNRKSSIYKNAPKFSIFGIGDYSFTKYKVAISGFYKEPIFALVYGDKPIMLDDTCYFIGFDNFTTAAITMLILNSDIVQYFIKSIAFLDSKRPYTKEILMRIDLIKVVNFISYETLLETGQKLNIDIELSEEDFISYKNYLTDYSLKRED